MNLLLQMFDIPGLDSHMLLIKAVYMWMWVRLRSGGSTSTPPLRTHLPPQTWQGCAGKVPRFIICNFLDLAKCSFPTCSCTMLIVNEITKLSSANLSAIRYKICISLPRWCHIADMHQSVWLATLTVHSPIVWLNLYYFDEMSMVIMSVKID